MKLVYFSVTSNEIPNLSEACRQLMKNDLPDLRIFARTRTQLTDNPGQQRAFIAEALKADAVVITLMAGEKSCPAWADLIREIDARRASGDKCPYFHVQPTGSNPESLELVETCSDGVKEGNWKTLSQYYRYGGMENLSHMIGFLAHLSCGLDISGNTGISSGTGISWQPPRPLPHEALYHPELGHISDKDSYLAKIDPARPTVGIWFYQNFWATGNKAHIDTLILELEKQGANVVCVFHMRFKDKLVGNRGADYVVSEFFMNQGKPRIDVLLNPVMFSLKTAAKEYKNLLKTLNVPVIQVLTTSRSVEEWQDSEQGLTNVDITISVAQPELDGVLIGVPAASKQTVGTDPITGAAVNKYVPIPERISRLVRLSLNWAALGRIANPDKKVAIVFHHYPPRNDRIGCASGLDSFASVVALLKEMKCRGYRVENDYTSGDELAHALLSCMTCDRR